MCICVCGRYMSVNVYLVSTCVSMCMWWVLFCQCKRDRYMCVNVYVIGTSVSMCM